MKALASVDPVAVPEADAVTTRVAAQTLGVSVGTVLNMIARGELPAWRTSGGHRRVDRAALDRLVRDKHRPAPAVLSVMVIEDDEFLRAAYADQFAHWNLPVEVRLHENGIGAMIDIGRHPPDLLVTDLRMPEIDGFSVTRFLRADERYRDMSIIVVSGLSDEEIARGGGLPPAVARWTKPVPFPQLRGFIEAMVNGRLLERAQ